MIGRFKDLPDSQLAAYSLEELSSKLRSVIGQERDRRSVHVGAVVAECSGDRKGGNCSQGDRPGNLGVKVADHQEKAVSVFRPAGVVQECPWQRNPEARSRGRA
jgi:hypothetical protein